MHRRLDHPPPFIVEGEFAFNDGDDCGCVVMLLEMFTTETHTLYFSRSQQAAPTHLSVLHFTVTRVLSPLSLLAAKTCGHLLNKMCDLNC